MADANPSIDSNPAPPPRRPFNTWPESPDNLPDLLPTVLLGSPVPLIRDMLRKAEGVIALIVFGYEQGEWFELLKDGDLGNALGAARTYVRQSEQLLDFLPSEGENAQAVRHG